jgi:hypothetical protein
VLIYGDRDPWPADDLSLPLEDVEAATGWTPKPEGLCRGEVCVPFDVRDGRLEVGAFARVLGQPVVREGDVWVVGAVAREVASGVAPDFTLPDADGRLHSLSEQRGKKVLLASWASW